MNNNALVGFTGFVGSNLRAQHPFEASFNSASISTAAGRRFATVVCAAAPGSMFEANRLPQRDAERIDTLIAHLDRIEADRFVLISTIAALAHFDGGVDETTQEFQRDLTYGRNRRRLEKFCLDRFANCLIVRLPALFGPRLRKNFLFDLLNPVPAMLPPARLDVLVSALPSQLGQSLVKLYSRNAELGMMVLDRDALNRSGGRPALDESITALGAEASGLTAPGSTFQYYPIERLWADIMTALEARLDVIHLVPAPLGAAAIHHRLTGRTMLANAAKVHHEDIRTRHAALFGGRPPYLTDAKATLEAIARFAHTQSLVGAAG